MSDLIPRTTHTFRFYETKEQAASSNAAAAKADFLKSGMVRQVYRDYEYLEVCTHMPVKRYDLMFHHACIQKGHCDGCEDLEAIRDPKLSLPVPGEAPF